MGRLRQAWWYAGLVEERHRFALRELRRAGGVHVYAVRGSATRIAIRHANDDAFVMNEVWRGGDYEPPPGALEALQRRRPLRVADLGGHVGLFAAWVLARFPGAEVTSFEPDADNRAALLRCRKANAAERVWRVVDAFAATADGTAEFVALASGLSHRASPGESGASEVRAVDALPVITAADYVKLDVEGAEWPILSDPRFVAAPPPVLVLEWHSVPGAPVDNPKRRAIDLLAPLGYRIHHPVPHDALPVDEPLWAAGVLWAWRDERTIVRP